MKTRLGAVIGSVEAERCYRCLVENTKSLLLETKKSSMYEFTPHWAIAEESEVSNPLWRSFPRIGLGEGGLGSRLHHVYERLLGEYQIAVLVGADCPLLSLKHIERAASMAKESGKLILGPAHDGGFYLAAGSNSLSSSVWKSVPYGTGNTRRELVRLLGDRVDDRGLPLLRDLDVIEDIVAFASAGNRHVPDRVKVVIEFAQELFGSRDFPYPANSLYAAEE